MGKGGGGSMEGLKTIVHVQNIGCIVRIVYTKYRQKVCNCGWGGGWSIKSMFSLEEKEDIINLTFNFSLDSVAIG